MGFRVETGLLNLEVDQYAGKGQKLATVESIAAAARKIEELGFDGAMAPEAGQDPFLPLAIAAEHTRRVMLGTNVAIAFPRSPMVVAQTAWDLQHLSRGRFQLGLGTQVKGHNERRYGTPWTAAPGPRLREYLQCLGAIFASFENGSKPTYFKGEHYQFTMLPPFFNPGPTGYPRPQIYIAAVNKYMTRLAGELCDGLRLHPIGTFTYTKEVLLPVIAAGAKKANRDPSAVDVVGAPFLALGANEKEVVAAREELKQRVAFYASTRTYHSVLDFHGWGDIGLQLHQLSLENKWQELPKLLTDEMLEHWAIVGTYDELVPKLKKSCTGAFSTILLDLPPALRKDEDRVREIVRQLHEA